MRNGIFTLLTVMLLSGCVSQATYLGDYTFQSSDKTYTLKMGPGWDIYKSDERSLSMTLGNATSETILIGATLTLKQLSDEQLADAAKELTNSIANELRDASITSSKIQRTAIGGLRYVQIAGDGILVNKGKKLPILISSYLIIGNKHAYFLLTMGTEDSFLDEQEIIRRIPRHFREL